MRRAVTLARGPGYHVAAVSCTGDHARWSVPEVRGGYRLVLVRHGRFLRQAGGPAATIDTTLGYLGVHREEERFAHPAGGDGCTAISLSPRLWRQLAGDTPGRRPTIYVDGRLELAHRRLISQAADGDADFAVAEELLALVAAAIRRTASGLTPAGAAAAPAALVSAAASVRDRDLVAAARDAIAADDPAARGLVPLADLLGVSPFRLSRAFSRELGVSLTHYRNRVRVSRAIARIEAGHASLGVLAAELGFADQAHLTRVVRAHTGHTPALLRRLLNGA